MTTAHNEITIVLLSGGMDSATCLALARHAGFSCHTLSFDYGQRHRIELQAAAKISSALGALTHRTLTLDTALLGGSALTGATDVPKHRSDEQLAEGIPVTYVPARNTVFLAMALAVAEQLEAFHIYIGANQVDYSGYPDCRGEYLEAFENMANLALKSTTQTGQRLHIHRPLLDMTKADIIRTAVDLGVDLSKTISCYDPTEDGRACGACDSCTLRRRGFEQAGVTDPTVYVS